MKYKTTIILLGLVILNSVVSANSFAEKQPGAMQKMATIMQRLKHFPSPQSKQTLKQIVNDSTTSKREKIIATSILNLNHRALTDDKAKLKKIVEDSDASKDERDFASILYNFDHRPTKADKARLKEMMQ